MTKLDPYQTVLREVMEAVPSRYSRSDWHVAIGVLLDLHAGLTIERVRARLTSFEAERAKHPDTGEPVLARAVWLDDLRFAEEQVRGRV